MLHVRFVLCESSLFSFFLSEQVDESFYTSGNIFQLSADSCPHGQRWSFIQTPQIKSLNKSHLLNVTVSVRITVHQLCGSVFKTWPAPVELAWWLLPASRRASGAVPTEAPGVPWHATSMPLYCSSASLTKMRAED
jgi:hypothetical protein